MNFFFLHLHSLYCYHVTLLACIGWWLQLIIMKDPDRLSSASHVKYNQEVCVIAVQSSNCRSLDIKKHLGAIFAKQFHLFDFHIQVQKRSFRECAGETTPCIPSECVGLRETYFNCKRGQVCFPFVYPSQLHLVYVCACGLCDLILLFFEFVLPCIPLSHIPTEYSYSSKGGKLKIAFNMGTLSSHAVVWQRY